MRIKPLIGKILYNTTASLAPSWFVFRLGTMTFEIKWGVRYRAFLAKMIGCKIGKEAVNIEKHVTLPDDLITGHHCSIGKHCFLSHNVKMGNYVVVGPEVCFYTSNHKFSDLTTPIYNQGLTEKKPIKIGNDVWIGRRVILLPGCEIPDGCVIGAGSIVTGRKFPPYSVIAGNPARVIKMRDGDRFERSGKFSD